MVWIVFNGGIPIALHREVAFFAEDGSGSHVLSTSMGDWQSLRQQMAGYV